jgi:hypothetical protein
MPLNSGSSEYVSKLRPASGLRWMLMFGPSRTCTPSARASRPIAAAAREMSSGFHVAAIATPVGKAVAASPRVERTPFGPSAKRIAGMPRRGNAVVEKLSAPATSAAFSFSVRRTSRSVTRCSSAAAEFL